MARTIESRVVTVGNGVSGFAWGYDFGPPIGSPYGSINNSTSLIYGNNLIRTVHWLTNSGGTISFGFEGVHDNEGWDTVEINGTSYSRTSMTYAATINDFYGPKTWWYLSGVSNPITQTVGATFTVNVKHNGARSANGEITLNDIHQDAGGSSGTSVSINDADIRAASWYGAINGATPASGATQRFTDFYYPSAINDTTILRRTDSTATGGTNGTTGLTANINTGGNGQFQTFDGDYSVTVQATSTDTFIKIRSSSGTKTVYDRSGNSSTGAAMEEMWKSTGFPATACAMQSTSTYTFVNSIFPGSWSYSRLPNAVPSVGTHLSNNLLTSFTSMTTNTEYGRKVIQRITTDGTQGTVGVLRQTTRFTIYLRTGPNGTSTKNDKNIALSFLIHNTLVVTGEN